MKSPKYHYELTFLAKPDLNETELADCCEKVSLACSQEHPLLKSDQKKRIKLAYPIKKQKEAFLVSISFQADPQTVLKIKKEMDGCGEVLRFLIIKKRTVLEEPKPSVPEIKKQEETIAPRASEEKTEIAPTKKEKRPKKTASMEDIEKDLEKILGE